MFAFVTPAHAATTGFHVSNGRILEGNGNDYIMRGVSHAHAWYPDKLNSLADIKALGANTVRVVLSTGGLWTKNDATDVSNVIAKCKASRLICVLEAHDTTGYGEQNAITLSQAADYWVGLKSILAGQESYIIVNIGNEPYGNNNTSGWTADTKGAIQKVRNAGIHNMLMVDAPNWGQDWSNTMRDNAASVFAADTDANTVFSIHMYGVYNTASKVSDYLNYFVTAKLPIVVGEFGNMHSDGDPDEDSIMSYAQSLKLGYLGWSWSGNGGGVEYLDMVTNFNASQLTTWGQRIFNGANGIKSTAKEATVFGGGGTNPPTGDTTAPTAPTNVTSPSKTANSVSLSWTASTDNVGVTGYQIFRNGTQVGTSTTTSYTDSGLTASTAYSYTVKARDAAGNVSAASAALSVTTSASSGGGTGGGTGGNNGGGTNAGCTATYTPNSWQDGFTADVTVKAGTSAISSWKVVLTFPGNQKVTSSWNANVTQSGTAVTATNMSYNGAVAANGSTSFGFQGTYSGTNGAPTVTCTAS
ncbi:cellulase family glycosylhydrolase [Streptomyces sp. NPDC092296]|uniref:cellulase family glycosylhydrolase n=1 Tax=Streptomyces sp. NPDC092296 TaxID=3366012 RepID=UPI0038277071